MRKNTFIATLLTGAALSTPLAMPGSAKAVTPTTKNLAGASGDIAFGSPLVSKQGAVISRVPATRAQLRLVRLTRDPNTARRHGKKMAAARGWRGYQFTCLNNLWNRESGWKYTAKNPTADTWGIPQALPGRKMASFGPDWRTNPIVQMQWGMHYIKQRYHTPCAAWSHSQKHNWY